jgi:hypothetical protein
MTQTPATKYSNSEPSAPDYIVVVSNDDDIHCGFHQFEDKVNRKLRDGYQLLGQPFNINHTLCQAMVRMGCPQSRTETTVFCKNSQLAVCP